MRSGVIAQKLGMTRIFTDAGEHVPVTVLKVDHCQVVAHRTEEKNGYTALQVGVGKAKVKNVSKAERGRFAVAQVEPKRKLAEFRVAAEELIPVGAEITADMPLIKCATLAAIVHELAAGRSLVAPTYQGQRGHPVGLGKRFGAQLLALDGDAGARDVIAAHQSELVLVECDDPGVLQDIDRREDLTT